VIVAGHPPSAPEATMPQMRTRREWPELGVGPNGDAVAPAGGAPRGRSLANVARGPSAGFDSATIRAGPARSPPSRGAPDCARFWATAIALSLGVHAGVFVAILVWPSPPPSPASVDVIPVEIVIGEAAQDAAPPARLEPAPAAAAPELVGAPKDPPPVPVQPVQPAPAPPGLERIEAAEPAASSPGPPTPPPGPIEPPPSSEQPVLAAPPAPEPPPPAATLQARAPPAAQEPAGSRAEPPPRAPARAPPQTRSGEPKPNRPAAPAVSGAELAAYQGAVAARLSAVKRYPDAARERAPQGVAVVSFSIAPTGEAAAISLSRSAGDPMLDAEAVATVRRANPFPPPPVGAPRNFSAPISFRVRQ
jgi:periplasmic protein TonB